MVDRDTHEWIEQTRSSGRRGAMSAVLCVLVAATCGCQLAAQRFGSVIIENASGVQQAVEIRAREQQGDERTVTRVDLAAGGKFHKDFRDCGRPPVELTYFDKRDGAVRINITDRIPWSGHGLVTTPGALEPFQERRYLRCVLGADGKVEFITDAEMERKP